MHDVPSRIHIGKYDLMLFHFTMAEKGELYSHCFLILLPIMPSGNLKRIREGWN
jgi:hypothetical protein